MGKLENNFEMIFLSSTDEVNCLVEVETDISDVLEDWNKIILVL